ncbi:MAG: tRNA1(Val) (adenine(37)-N6)-methyltransferase [Bacilli bacterium]|nr:tRNA1(Val) (adenine(37)-N6)-methyltransferase [Bacilli bacterium]
MKVINDLLGYNLKIVQDTDYFNFSLDSVLLVHFLNLKKNMKILDICSGNCPIPLMLSTKTNSKIVAVEIQKEIYNLAKESIELNDLQNQIELLNMDAKDLTDSFETDSFDLITCNPPYFKNNDSSKKNDNSIKTIARHELMINLEDIMRLARKLLKNNGSLVMVHRPERLSEIISIMLKNNISPKRIQFIYPKDNKESNMLIIEGTKNGNNSLKVLEPMIIHNEDGSYKDNIKDIFKTIE